MIEGKQVAELNELPPLVVLGSGVGQLVHQHHARLLPGEHHQHPLHTLNLFFSLKYPNNQMSFVVHFYGGFISRNK